MKISLQRIGWLMGAYPLFGFCQLITAAPRIVTNPTGKNLDTVTDDALDWLFNDIRPLIIIPAIIVGAVGLAWGGKMRWKIFGGAVAGIIVCMALPRIISEVWQWMF